MKTRELASYLRISRNSLVRAISVGDYADIPCKRINRRGDYRFDKDEVMDYIKRKFN